MRVTRSLKEQSLKLKECDAWLTRTNVRPNRVYYLTTCYNSENTIVIPDQKMTT